MTRSLDNLQITFTANTGSGVFSILNQYEVGNLSAIEEMQFADNVQFGAGDIVWPVQSECDERRRRRRHCCRRPGFRHPHWRRRPGRAVRRRRQRHPVRRGRQRHPGRRARQRHADWRRRNGYLSLRRNRQRASRHHHRLQHRDQEKLDLSALLDANFGSRLERRPTSCGCRAPATMRSCRSTPTARSGGANWQDVAVLSNYGSPTIRCWSISSSRRSSCRSRDFFVSLPQAGERQFSQILSGN